MEQSDHILVVDDAPTVRQMLRLMLEEAGYRVDLAASASEALASIAERSYDLLIVDKNLDGEDGFAICRAARDLHPDAARIVVTADQSVESAIRAVEEDIFAYLPKPLRKQQVLLKVRRALDRVRLTREREKARTEMQAAKEALERRTEELERTLAKLVKAQARLSESEKLVSVALLAAGVAHEINNPACFILPNLEYIKRSANVLGEAAVSGTDVERAKAEVEHIYRMVDRCLEGVGRIQKVVSTLQLFSRREPAEPRPVDLNDICRSLLDLVTHELEGRARLDVELQPLAEVQGQPKELAQVVLNLLLNARRAIFASTATTEHRIKLRTEMLEGEVVLTVTDSGTPLPLGDSGGPPPDSFFFGDSEQDPSPGLSLGVVRDILDRHGGRLLVHSDAAGNHWEARLPVASGA